MRRLVVVALLACSSKKEPPPPATTQPPPKPTPADAAVAASSPDAAAPRGGVELDAIDKSVKPGDDFFKYANGAWLAKTEIPADRSNWGAGGRVAELTAKRTAEVIQDAAKNAAPGTDARKVGDYYATFMDEAAIEQKGIEPLKPELDAIGNLKDAAQLAHALGASIRGDTDPINNTNFETTNIFGLWVAQDLDDPSRYLPFLMQGGLAMPDRDYYLDGSARMADLRKKYEAHVAKMFELAKLPDPAGAAKRVLELETKIAQAHATRVDNEDVHKGDNHWKRDDFDKKAPGMDWAQFFDGAGLAKQTDFAVWQPKAITGVAAAVKSTPLASWKEFLTAHALDRAAPFLSKAFVDEEFAFYNTGLAGIPTLRERWKRGVDDTSLAMGEAVGKLYVTKYFPESEKQRAAEMVKQLIAAFGRRIDGLAWMTDATKQKAKAKLAVLKVGVGYPDKWRDYSGLEIVKGDALGNAARADKFEYAYQIGKLGKPVDRGEWCMVPQLVNAVNLPALNALNFPAAILQPPYFDPNRPEVMDYGSIGAVIGHEISHSFDDQGAQFDATGKLANWWTKDDYTHFKDSATRLEKQYDAYKPFPDLHLNGKQTISENIADVAGLAVAYDAYRASLGGKEAPAAQGLTGDQQFFVSFAQAWQTKYRDEALRRRVLTDGHSPAEYRGDTVRNLDAWYAAFDVKPTDKLYLAPDTRVRVW